MSAKPTGLEPLPQMLYKYLGPERVGALANRLLRYTPLGAFNDPFEGRPHITVLAPDGELRKIIKEIIPSETKDAYDDLAPEIRGQVSY